MKERYTDRPQATWLELLNERPGAVCVVHFEENITAIQEPDEEGILQTFYEADHYCIETGYREGILEAVEANRAQWLAAAMEKDQEGESKTIKTRVKELETASNDMEDIIDEILITLLTEE